MVKKSYIIPGRSGYVDFVGGLAVIIQRLLLADYGVHLERGDRVGDQPLDNPKAIVIVFPKMSGIAHLKRNYGETTIIAVTPNQREARDFRSVGADSVVICDPNELGKTTAELTKLLK